MAGQRLPAQSQALLRQPCALTRRQDRPEPEKIHHTVNLEGLRARPTRPTVDSCCHPGTLWRFQTAGSIGGRAIRAKDWGTDH